MQRAPYTDVSMKKYQSGSTLIEGMIAILIFSFGMLGTMSFQANMLSETTQTSYRLNASMYVNSLVGAAQSDPINIACYTYPTLNSASNCTSAKAYMTQWGSDVIKLKGASTVSPSAVYDATAGSLTITVYWKLPQEKSDVLPHSLSSVITPMVSG